MRAYVALVSLLACSTTLFAENRFFFSDTSLPAGATNQEVLLRADNDVDIYGFSFGVNYDETALTVVGVAIAGTDSANADFINGKIDTARGLVGYGCVLDWDEPLEDFLPPGTNRILAKLLVDVLGSAGTSSQLKLESVPTNPDPGRPVKNVMTNNVGQSIPPTLVAGTVSIVALPAIESVSGNAGWDGTVFTVVGDAFDHPGLAVTVCSEPAAATLQPDGRTLLVTAPDASCPGPVWAAVEVSTAYGSDSKAQGFYYWKKFARGDANFDTAWDISDAITILMYLFTSSVVVTCPDALDADDLAEVELTDAIFLLNFMFRGTTSALPPPYPDAGRDPTDDGQGPCL